MFFLTSHLSGNIETGEGDLKAENKTFLNFVINYLPGFPVREFNLDICVIKKPSFFLFH